MNRDTFTKWLNRYAEARIDMAVLTAYNESYEESKRNAQKAKQKLLQFHKDWYKPAKKYTFNPANSFVDPFSGLTGKEITERANK